MAATISLLLVAGSLALGLSLREDPARCPEGLVRAGPACCGEGQTYLGGRCTGKATACALGQHFDASGGCTRESQRVRVQGELVSLAGADWEGKPAPFGTSRVRTFDIDSVEVSGERYARCVQAGVCRAVTSNDPPGLPLRHVTPEQGQTFCRWVGGRLPTGSEWLLAAAGQEGRRYPWGFTGLVCRRAAFGLESGPCASGATAPEPPGSRPNGATPDGVHDLSGNVAEWTREGNTVRARGGSYRSRGAADLKSFAAEEQRGAAPDVGFRCVYPAEARAAR